jgi:KDO2-lipid IV(A) lauroyltransferase
MKSWLKSTSIKMGFGILRVFSLLPLSIHYLISDFIYFFTYYVIHYRRGVVRSNLTSSFPEKSEKEIAKIERDFYHWFCDYLVETFKLATISHKEMKCRMKFKGVEQIEQIIAEGQSCGILLGHYCNWEWITALPMNMSGKGLCAELYHPLENKDVDNFFLDIRQRFGSLCIPMDRALRDMVRYRKEGRPLVIGYIADQKPTWRNIYLWMPFLNHLTPMLTGSERIIKRTGQAFFYGDMRRIKRGYYECEFKLIERHPEHIPDYKLTERYMQELELSIRRDPAYWLWTHDRWQRTKEEFDYRFEIVDGKVFERIGEADYAKHMGWKNYWHH